MGTRDNAKEESWRREIALAQSGDTETRDKLVRENMGLVYMAARRFENRGAEKEELIQTGAIGLIKAIDHFDITLPYAFSTYAVPRIIGEIRRFLRDYSMIHVSRSIKENAGKIAAVREKKKKIENREPTLEELRRLTGISEDDLIIALGAAREIGSISEPSFDKDGRLGSSECFEEEVINKLAVHQVMERLSGEEEELIRLRYLEGRTQSETAALLKTNQVAVSRAEQKILRKLRQFMPLL